MGDDLTFFQAYFSFFSGCGFGAGLGAALGVGFAASFGAAAGCAAGGACVALAFATGVRVAGVGACAGAVGRVSSCFCSIGRAALALAGVCAGGVTALRGGAPLAPTTPGPLNAAGRAVAAMAGWPPFALAESCGVRSASCTC